jgi:Outer membrane lipoprotein
MYHKSAVLKCLITFVILINFINTAYSESIDLTAPYAIVLASSNSIFTEKDLGITLTSNKHRYYSVRVKSKGKIRHQLRFGFFTTKKSAKKAQKKLNTLFNKTYLVKTSQRERNASSKTEIKPKNQLKLADYLILSTTYSAANVLVDAAKDSLNKLQLESTATPEKKAEKRYDSYIVINLKTTNNLADFDKIRQHPEIINHAFYLSQMEIDKRTWYQYRLGFFIDSKQAREKLNSLISDFPLARLIRISRDEKEDAAIRIRSFFAAIPTKDIKKPLPRLAPVSTDKLKTLIKQGSKALSDKNYTLAISLFSQLLRYPENRYSMDAQEFLGFARELNGQTAYAKTEYERYLSLYPESSGADRVRQRLAGLITARQKPSKKLRDARRRKLDGKWRTFGSFSQFYRKHISQLNDEEVRENLSLLDSSLNINSRYRSENYDMRSRFTGSHSLNYTGDQKENSGSVSSLYFDAADLINNWSGRIGRQSSSKGGVLGRFDGAQLGYQINDHIKLNTVAGLVVEDSEKGGNSDKSFVGISTDLGTFKNAWDLNLYYIQQNDGKIIGRQAVGSEIRYFHPNRTLFTLIDYDTLFKELNTLLAIGNWRFENKVEVNATVDIRKSPILTTSNALQGRTEQSIDELLNVLSEEQIKALALEQTATSKSFIVGINNPLSDNYQLSNDITVTKLSSSIVGGVPVPGTDSEYFYNIQLTGNDVITDGDSAIFGIRYSDTSTSKTTSFSTNIRFPVATKWRLNPRYRIDLRKNDDGTNQSVNALSLKVDYRWKRHINFELDMGGERSNRKLDLTTDRTNSYFFSMGYRYDFF